MKDYIQKCLRTKSEVPIISRLSDKNIDLLHGAMGISTEANEILDVMKKHLFYGKEINELDLMYECSDCLWYIAIILNQLGYSFDEVMTKNIEKLKKRYPEKFTEECAINRNVENELSHF